MKSEPDEFGIDDLAAAPGKTTAWFGVRNYQARNFLRDDMKVGDGVLFYASNADPSGVTGLAEIAREGYPDPTAFDPKSRYYDPKTAPDNPIWYRVDVRFAEAFPEIIPLETLKAAKGLEKMVVVQKGSRLSVQPVAKAEFEIVKKLGRKRGKGA